MPCFPRLSPHSAQKPRVSEPAVVCSTVRARPQARLLNFFRKSGNTVGAPHQPVPSAKLDQFEAGLRNQRLSELSALQQLRHPAVPFRDQPLLRYMQQKAALDQRIEGGLKDRLCAAHASVCETRERFSYGRGNVNVDNAANGFEGFRRLAALRDVYRDQSLDYPARAAASVKFQVGNCGENGVLATHLHSNRLTPGYMVSYVESLPIGHCWAELTADHGSDVLAERPISSQDIVLDPWGEGPAVLRQDSWCANDLDRIEPLLGYRDPAGFRVFAQELQQQRDLSVEKYLQPYQAAMPGKQDKIWAPTPIIDAAFEARAALQEQRIAAGAALQQQTAALYAAGVAKEGLSHERLAQQGQLNLAILRAGVERTLRLKPQNTPE